MSDAAVDALNAELRRLADLKSGMTTASIGFQAAIADRQKQIDAIDVSIGQIDVALTKITNTGSVSPAPVVVLAPPPAEVLPDSARPVLTEPSISG